MIRVAHVGRPASGRKNGVQVTLNQLVQALPDHGVEVELWNADPRVDRYRVRLDDDVVVVDLPFRRLGRLGFGGLSRETAKVLEERASKTDVLHLHSVYRADNVSIARQVQLPIVITPNGGRSPEAERRSVTKKRVWKLLHDDDLLGRASVLHAVSEREHADLRQLAPELPVVMAPNGLGAAAIKNAPSFDPNGPFVFLGRLDIEHKGLDRLLAGYALARRSSSKFPPLVLAGPEIDGSTQQLRSLSRRLGIDSQVDIRGPAYGADKSALLNSARCFVHTSRWEGMPFAVIEALGHGLPVLVTDGTNLGTNVQCAAAGVRVGDTPPEIAFGLERIAGSTEQELRAMGAHAIELVRSQFSLDATVAKLASVYRALAQS